MKGKQISIWFLIGLQLVVYGVLIGGASVYEWIYPAQQAQVVLANLHAGVWLSLVMLILGLVYVFKFWPARSGR
jgi:hypothetical protein